MAETHRRIAPLAAIALLPVVAGVLESQSPPPGARTTETYASAAIDSSGDLVIVTSGGRRVAVRKERDQTSYSAPLLSPPKNAVGAQAMFGNCCTSYDIPLKLVVYVAGKAHRFVGAGLPIYRWAFADSGRRVAYAQEPLHFACETHYELRDIESERLVDSADIPQPCGQRPNPASVPIPQWVADLLARPTPSQGSPR